MRSSTKTRFLRRDRRVARDHSRGDATGRLDTERQRRNVEEQHVAHFALQHATLDRSADRDDFVGVNALVWLFAGELLRDVDDLRHAGHAAHQHEFVDVGRGEFSVLQARLERLNAALEERFADLLHLRSSERDVEMLWTGSVRRDEGQIDVNLLRGRECDLRFLGFFLQTLERHRILA